MCHSVTPCLSYAQTPTLQPDVSEEDIVELEGLASAVVAKLEHTDYKSVHNGTGYLHELEKKEKRFGLLWVCRSISVCTAIFPYFVPLDSAIFYQCSENATVVGSKS